ncbi:MAG: undecaprenyldiphospho-muramoylpentapeptide beta-N-acetylglucosaminyltransferase [Raineya sp.]|nr:undecaprenyldiphospho-muramoylpentapeptide beta-N-acetylglucosaminyltransferase [Raineya sp.]MDW8297553.1 undecaprenyldiphospho-muramoylpentapeptide beta-N-acetylglucosaminyltransferase [Raineya sp.]
MKRVIISGGGTGGHIYPAIAIANELKHQAPATEILFVGANNRMEMQKVPLAGYKIIGLDIAGIQRKLSLENLRFPIKLFKSLKNAREIIKEFRPDVCVGVGGYASAPTLLMASFMKIPTLIQEQNSYAGIANKVLARKAQKICVAYPQMDKYFPKGKIVFTGNPVRKDILELENKRATALQYFGLHENKKTLLIIGGSLGARTINLSIQKNLKRLIENDIQVIWQTGKHFYTTAQRSVADEKTSLIKVFEFINVMDLAYAAADVVISRAGALSISELCLAGKPCILVPSPNVAEDHQTKNAQVLVNNKAALMVADKHAEAFLVGDAIDLLYDELLQKELQRNIKRFAKPNAAQEIVREIMQIW